MSEAKIIGTVKGQQYVTAVCENCGAIFRGTGTLPIADADSHSFERGHIVSLNINYRMTPMRDRARPVLRLVE